ncbi:kunitz-type serine protease inhibitor Bt-KTI [Drosophila grimshawi]|uniref:GH13178 n=1 Tax=Drosophila grimshawi TaxID=7222 RepID=B4JQI5_DROGR|nr:kunitz-type serine protease inhibitor Bt-KTI [Drosophila grimshawi]EDV99165.1 GH13178 [Drosophila grimshawi]
MSYKLGLIALSVLICALCVHSAAMDQSQLVVEKQQEDGQTTGKMDTTNVPEECHQPKETGRCFALFYRYAYNLDTHSCEEFVYGGCAGNSNNFETKEQCEQVCLGKSASATEQSTELTTEQVQQAAETTPSSTSS